MRFSNQNMHKCYHTFQNTENKLKVSRTVFVLSRGGILKGKSARKFECYNAMLDVPSFNAVSMFDDK